MSLTKPMRILTTAALIVISLTASASDFVVGFSPCWSGRVCAQDVVIQAIEMAKPGKPLLMAAYSFTSKPIALALIEAHKRGVQVRVVADAKSNGKRFSVTQVLTNNGIPVRLNDRYAIHHHKFLVINSDSVETGSFNYTKAAAEKNAENALLIRGESKLAAEYAKEWERLWREGEDVAPQ